MSAFRSLSARTLFVFSILVLSVALLPASDYSIDSFDSTITVNETGIYEIVEKAHLTFFTPMYGFYRTIPTGYRLQDGSELHARLTRIRASEEMKVESSWYETVIRLGSASRTVTGGQDYMISYRFDLGEDLYDDRDEFYFNIIGTEWAEPLGEVSFTVNFPLPVKAGSIEMLRGAYGSTGTAGIEWSLSQDGKTIRGTASQIDRGEALTVRVVMEEGYFAERPNYTFWMLPLFLLAILFTLWKAYTWWTRYGKDTPPVIVPRFTAPDGMTPMDVGYLIDQSLDPHDLTSMIFYWADRGNLTIIEEGKKYTFVRGNPLKESSPHEQELFTSFFALGSNGVVTEKDLKGEFYKVFQKLHRKVASYYTKERSLQSEKATRKGIQVILLSLLVVITLAFTVTINYPDLFTFILIVVCTGYLVLNSVVLYRLSTTWYTHRNVGKVFSALLLVLLFLVVVIAGYTLAYLNGSDLNISLIVIPVGVLTLFALSLASIIMRQRSAYGQRKLEEVLGLRDFIETVEMDELKRMIDKDPAFYYRLLSYAIVLGLEKKWAKKFSSFTIEPPSWYSGNRALVGSMMVSSVIHSCDSALISNVAPPKTTSSSGGHFSGGGGGFSGGGFGGGGGGGW